MIFFFHFDPLEQFDIILLFTFFFSTFTNFTFVLVLNLLFLFFLFFFVLSEFFFFSSNNSRILFLFFGFFYSFNNFFLFLKNLYNLVVEDIIEENINLKKKSFVLIIFFLFLFLFFSNFIGLIPFSYTVTSSLILTFFLSLTFFIAINFLGFFFNKSTFFRTFLPGGTPLFIAPLLILIEVVSYFSRVFSLSIRLFANMMSGHALLKILIGFSWNALLSGVFGFFLSTLPWVVVTVVVGLELAIAGLQAYVFTILICIYINDALNPH